MNTFKEFENSIGKRFKVVDGDGKPFHGLLGERDTISNVNIVTGEVEGDKFIAHFSSCRFIQGVPEHLKISHQLKSTHMDPKDQTEQAEGQQQEEENKDTSSSENTDTGNDEGSEKNDDAKDDE